MEEWPIKGLKAAPMSRKLKIIQNAKSCSKQKKLLEIRKVAKKLPSKVVASLNKVCSTIMLRKKKLKIRIKILRSRL